MKDDKRTAMIGETLDRISVNMGQVKRQLMTLGMALDMIRLNESVAILDAVDAAGMRQTMVDAQDAEAVASWDELRVTVLTAIKIRDAINAYSDELVSTMTADAQAEFRSTVDRLRTEAAAIARGDASVN